MESEGFSTPAEQTGFRRKRRYAFPGTEQAQLDHYVAFYKGRQDVRDELSDVTREREAKYARLSPLRRMAQLAFETFGERKLL